MSKVPTCVEINHLQWRRQVFFRLATNPAKIGAQVISGVPDGGSVRSRVSEWKRLPLPVLELSSSTPNSSYWTGATDTRQLLLFNCLIDKKSIVKYLITCCRTLKFTLSCLCLPLSPRIFNHFLCNLFESNEFFSERGTINRERHRRK